MIKTDCLNCTDRGCKALDKTYCEKTDNCKFYKTQTMLNEQVARIRKRIPGYNPSATQAEWEEYNAY